MEETPSIEILLESCRQLFSPQVNICLDFIKYLQVDGLKSAYREKIKKCHPDKARALGEQPATLQKEFLRISNAYESLLPYVMGEKDVNRLITEQKKPGIGHAHKPRQRQEQPYKPRDFMHTGSMPRKKHRLGMYLYYKRLISWQTLQEAIAWQRSHRPLIGQLALHYNFISVSDLNEIFLKIGPGESICAAAKRLGKLTAHQVNVLLGKQASYNFRIGRFFVEAGTFSDAQMVVLLEELSAHNRGII